jgi:hypothetical protein
MSKRIVKRFSLKSSHFGGEEVKVAKYQGQLAASLTLVPSGKVVELSCSRQTCCHRFHIVEHVPFDILLGKEFS